MHLITVKHAGVIIHIATTEHPEMWLEVEAKRIREQFPSARFEVLNLLSAPMPEPKKVARKAE